MQWLKPPRIHLCCSTALLGLTAAKRSFCTLPGLNRRLATTPTLRSPPQADARGDAASPSSVLHSPLFPVSPHTPDPSLSRTAGDKCLPCRLQAVSPLHVDILATCFFSARVAPHTHWAHSATHTAGPHALNISTQISTFRI